MAKKCHLLWGRKYHTMGDESPMPPLHTSRAASTSHPDPWCAEAAVTWKNTCWSQVSLSWMAQIILQETRSEWFVFKRALNLIFTYSLGSQYWFTRGFCPGPIQESYFCSRCEETELGAGHAWLGIHSIAPHTNYQGQRWGTLWLWGGRKWFFQWGTCPLFFIVSGSMSIFLVWITLFFAYFSY